MAAKNSIISALSALSLLIPSIMLAQVGNEEILATVGNSVISATEFRARFELLPRQLRRGDPGESQAKEELMLSLIAEKLLSSEAVALGLDNDALYLREIENVRRLLARDQLYRIEVQQKVHVEPDEISRALQNVQRALLVEYMYAADSIDLAGQGFPDDSTTTDVPSHDPSSSLLVDTITVRWGEAEALLESVVFSLKEGEQSGIVASSVGWFICRVISEFSNDQIASLGPLERREHVERIVRSRKEEARLDQYVRTVMGRATAKALKTEFRSLVRHIRMYANSHTTSLEGGISDEARRTLRKVMGPSLQDTLLVMNDHIMTVGDVLDRLYTTGYHIETTAYPKLEQGLNTIFRTWAWQGVLESVALEKGLDAHPDIDGQIQMWKDHYLAETYRRSLIQRASVSVVEIHRLRRFNDPSCATPHADIHLAWSGEQSNLRAYISDATQDNSPIMSESGSATVRSQVLAGGDLLALGSLAERLWEVPRGAWTPLSRTDTGFVAARFAGPVTGADIPDAEYDSLTKVLKSMKVRRAETILTAKLAGSRGYTVFEERLHQLRVSFLPMMTFRMLGFGGRMFAVPFVRPRIEWSGVDQDTGTVLP